MFGEYVYQQPSRDACVLALDAESYVSPKASFDDLFALLDQAYTVLAVADTRQISDNQQNSHDLLR